MLFQDRTKSYSKIPKHMQRPKGKIGLTDKISGTIWHGKIYFEVPCISNDNVEDDEIWWVRVFIHVCDVFVFTSGGSSIVVKSFQKQITINQKGAPINLQAIKIWCDAMQEMSRLTRFGQGWAGKAFWLPGIPAHPYKVSCYIQYLTKEHDCRCDVRHHFGPDDQTKFWYQVTFALVMFLLYNYF